jgi:large subunit ribosomal protein L18
MSDSSNQKTKLQRERRVWRVRSHIKGDVDRARMRVNISNRHVAAQIIDDSAHKTLVASTTVGMKSVKGNLTEKAKWVGEDIAKKAKAKNITKIVFDRGYKLYHGRVKALADSARENGLEF